MTDEPLEKRLVDEKAFLETSFSAIKDILGIKPDIQTSKGELEMYGQVIQEEDFGKYKNALSAALLLWTDADVRTGEFRRRITPWRHRTWSHETDGYYEAFVYGVGRAIQSYREPAETLISFIQELTGHEDLLSQMGFNLRDRRWLDARTRKEAELVEQWVEEQIKGKPDLYLKPFPDHLSQGLRSEMLELMRQNPEGIQVLRAMYTTLEMFHPSIECTPNPVMYGFRLGILRYMSALHIHFK